MASAGAIGLNARLDFVSAEGGRKAERQPVDLDAGLRQSGASGVSVELLDLSTDGFRASTHLHLAPGTHVWLKLPGLEPLDAKVAWSDRHFVGCSFVTPLHPAVLEMVARRPS